MSEIAAAAGVTVRSVYAHFPSKDALTVECLAATPLAPSGGDDDPRAQILAVFAPVARRGSYPGCPFLRAAAEFPDQDDPIHQQVRQRKLEFADRLSSLASSAGCANPGRLGAMLALLYDGAAARGAAIGSTEPFAHAAELAEQALAASLI